MPHYQKISKQLQGLAIIMKRRCVRMKNPEINKNIAWLNRYSKCGRGIGKTTLIHAIFLYRLKKFIQLQDSVRSKNPWHRYWESAKNKTNIKFPKQKHKIIMKIIHFLYKHFSIEKIENKRDLKFEIFH